MIFQRGWLLGPVCVVVGVLLGVSAQDVPVTAQAGCSKMNGDLNGDGKVAMADALLLLQYIFLPEAERPDLLPRCGPLPATGQTTCYDTSQVIDCAREDFPGQDGFYRAGCPTECRFVNNGDGTVMDTCTALMWQAETAPGRYTWQEGLQYCEKLGLAGHTDWRLPNVWELQSIVDYGQVGPTIAPIFPTVCNWYWSSSTYASTPDIAWRVCFGDGVVMGGSKSIGVGYVRAVRGGFVPTP